MKPEGTKRFHAHWRARLVRATRLVAGPRVSARSFLSLWRDISLFAAALAFLTGWAYVRRYYYEFRIDSGVLDISLNEYFVYALAALSHTMGAFLFLAMVAILGVLGRIAARVSVYATALAASFVAVFWLADVQGAMDGYQARLLLRQKFVPVTFLFKEEAFQKKLEEKAGGQDGLYLIRATKDRYFVTPYKQLDSGFPPPQTMVLEIPAGEVIAAMEVN